MVGGPSIAVLLAAGTYRDVMDRSHWPGALIWFPLISDCLGPAVLGAEERSSSAGCAVVPWALLSRTWVTLCPSTVTEPMLFSPIAPMMTGPLV